MQFIKPKKLRKGDAIGIISPASSEDDVTLVNKGIKYIESLGYRTELGKNLNNNRGYLAGTDEERIEDIHQMFNDKNVKAIFCLRGGYGASRLLDKIDYNLIKRNPKIFVGFSEITSLQMAFLKKIKLITFAGPMVVPNFSKNRSEYTEEKFWQLITSNKKPGKLLSPRLKKIPNINSGIASGRLVGGNLTVFTSLIGTKFFPELKDKILFLEDVSESPYKIDRMINQLRLNQVFKKVKGIILGRFVDCIEHDANKKTLTLGEIMHDYLKDINVPVIYTFPHGHVKDILTLPIGVKTKLNASRGFVEILENCVT